MALELESIFDEFTRRDWEREPVEGTVRLAIVGVGGFARNRAIPAIAESEYCEPTLLVTGSPDQRRLLAQTFDIGRVITYDAFLAGAHTEAYDAVYVATPNALHGRYAAAAADLGTGKHVICEKPLETTPDRVQTIIDACDDAGVTLMTAYRLQIEPAVRRTRELVSAGVIGDIVQVHAGFSHPLVAATGPDTWRFDPELAGGGALVDLGIYPLNTTRFVLGRDPTGVYATTASSTDSVSIGVDEHVTFQLEFPTDATASCTASFGAHANSWLELTGSDGLLSVRSPFGGVVPQEMVVESGEVRVEHTGPPVDEVREEFDYFGYCVLTGATPEPDGADGLIDTRVIEAAYESASTGCRVDLE
ncbi:D-xylose 1-dehydrogenase Gfo6 [Natrialba asiatica]|uniref:Glucose-fructose oxidoreductase n=1 Tax=Natrialba asiatica (strain ATCC 700177 / DSM 12278 / JCM 9576 / FERM P-10747 / NBRC 102637 / 172P1) TaxID=29540 RepID=M0ALC8_NATA1|nr:D-xylose 1-dehydrogenase Gfo6 [Natrialba asiatica]ELY99354.1 glucose-fructose oxidoreductase [Natrialba asiatica DSM 12278]